MVTKVETFNTDKRRTRLAHLILPHQFVKSVFNFWYWGKNPYFLYSIVKTLRERFRWPPSTSVTRSFSVILSLVQTRTEKRGARKRRTVPTFVNNYTVVTTNTKNVQNMGVFRRVIESLFSDGCEPLGRVVSDTASEHPRTVRNRLSRELPTFE